MKKESSTVECLAAHWVVLTVEMTVLMLVVKMAVRWAVHSVDRKVETWGIWTVLLMGEKWVDSKVGQKAVHLVDLKGKIEVVLTDAVMVALLVDSKVD